MRPKLILLTEFASRNDKAQDELDFGICNVDVKRTITIFLSNITEPTANWKLNYVKFPKKQTISKYTTTAWEEENLEKLDDPDVFEFSMAQVSYNIPLISNFFRILTKFTLFNTLHLSFNLCVGITKRQVRAITQGTSRADRSSRAKG